MDSKELQKQFRAAPWSTPQQLEAFVMACDAVPSAEIVKLLALLSEKQLASEGIPQRNRLNAFKRLVETASDPQLFAPFVKALKTADPSVRTVLVELLPRVNSVPAHAELAALLRQPDAALRKSIAQAMKQIGGKTIFELAVSLTREEHPGRAEAVELAAQIGGYHAISALELVVVNARGPERILALKHLGDSRLMAKNIAGALAAIGRVLNDPSEQVVVQAIASFSALCSEEEFHARLGGLVDSSSTAGVRALMDGARRFPSPRSFALLERRFRIGPNAVRTSVLNTLDAIGNDDSLPLLAEALASKSLQIRTKAGEVLSNLSLNKQVNLSRTLLWLLRSRDVNVRRMAVDIARKIGDPTGELWPSLLRFLRDEDWWVRERVTDALVDMAGTALTRHIVSYLQDPSDVVRRYAVDVLLRLKDPAALGALVRCVVGDTDWWVRERAMEAIALLKDQRAVPYLIDVMGKVPELRIAALRALGELGATSAGANVAALLGDEDVDVRLSVLACLALLGSGQLAPQVQGVVHDTDHRVRAATRELLERWDYGRDADAGPPTQAMTSLDRLLVELARVEGDDLLLAAGRVPYVKRLGKVMPLPGSALFTPESMQDLLWPHLTDLQKATLADRRDIDFSYEVKTEGLRFRANVFRQHSGLAAVFRIIKDKLLSIEKLGLPPIVQTFGDMKNGLVLVGGPTGSGKSTTLAAIIDYINRTSARHIVSLEDPIEVMHVRKQSLVNQREVGTHTRSFASALRSVLREDPDVLLVGEMRDLATISFAVSAAETGHLVFGTLHTVSADTTMDRLINAFPAGQQSQVRAMLAESLRAVCCQHLLRRADGVGRALAVEVMINNDAIANLIRKGKCFQIPSIIATQKEAGMQLMDGELRRLLRDGVISAEEAFMKANSKKEFEDLFNAEKQAASMMIAPPQRPGMAASSVGMPAVSAPMRPPAPSGPRPTLTGVSPVLSRPNPMISAPTSTAPSTRPEPTQNPRVPTMRPPQR